MRKTISRYKTKTVEFKEKILGTWKVAMGMDGKKSFFM